MARNARLLGLAVVLLLAGAAPALATSQPCTSGPLIEYWNGAAWTQQPISGSGTLRSVAALSSTDVWAVGTDLVGSHDRAFAEHWDGAAWTRSTLPSVGPKTDVDLTSISATSATDVWAAGGAVVERWDGTTWRIVPSPRHDYLSGISALSPTNVWAVGSYYQVSGTQMYGRTLVLHWNGSSWRRIPSPNPSEANKRGAKRDDGLSGVVALSPRDVWAVGSTFRNVKGHHHRAYQTLVLHWNGSSWKRVAGPNPGGLHETHLYAVAAVSRTDLWAVGGYHNGHGVELPLAERWNGKAWRTVSAPPGDPFSPDQALRDLSVVSGNDIWATGDFETDNGTDIVYEGLTEHWDGSSWTLVPIVHQWNEGDYLGGISALSPHDAWTVGAWESCS